jgi:predicted DNA-binding transcriptional regulator YafY
MARLQGQKLKILYLLKILKEETDEAHPLTLAEIIKRLSDYGISSERKSLYNDLESLRLFGYEIISIKSKTTSYYLSERRFSLPELKLLVDLVQSSKFITHKKSMEMIEKLEKLASVHEAKQLRRQVFVAGRVKNMNESIYYNTDAIHQAIAENKQISFRYFSYTVSKKRAYRRGGARYQISPLALSFGEENYYLIGYDGEAGQVKHYRVDRMVGIQVEEMPRESEDELPNLDLAAYAGKIFSMFSGEEREVTLWFASRLVSVVIDRFGKDAPIRPVDDRYFTVTMPVFVSPQFFGWLAGFGGEAGLIGPKEVVEAYQRHMQAVLDANPTHI